MGFVFYDTETTGKSTSFDQILQFAAIHTDHELNELDRFEVRCRLMSHIVPSPGALCVTRMSIEQIIHSELPSHYQMVGQIRDRLLAWSPAIFSGWNTIYFDEKMLRQALYQCLHPPYLTATEGNSRNDLMKVAQVSIALAPGVLNIPTDAKGTPVFKLDTLAPANGFNHANAHDAMADVEATIHVARIIRDAAPDLWNCATRFSQKAAVLDFLRDEPVFILSESYFGSAYQYALTPLGDDPTSPGTTLALDLTVDAGQLRQLNDAQLALRLRRSPKPVRRIKANAAPILMSGDDFDLFKGVTRDELMSRANAIAADEPFRLRLIAACAREEQQPSPHVEEQIYDSFTSREDAERLSRFHSVPWADRYAIICELEDARLRELGLRLIHAHEPDQLPAHIRGEEDTKLARRIAGHGHQGAPWTTLGAALAEAETRRASCKEHEVAILEGVSAYLQDRLQSIQANLGM